MSVKSFRWSSENCFQHVEKTMLSNFLLSKGIFFIFCLIPRRVFPEFCWNKMWSAEIKCGRQMCFRSVWKVFLMTKFFDTKLTLGGSVVISLQTLWSFFKTSPAGSSKSPSRCPEKLFEDRVSWNFYGFISICRLEEKTSGIYAKNLGIIVKAAL